MPKRNKMPIIAEGQLEINEFKGKAVRKALHDDEWYFSVEDVVEAVTGTTSPGIYWTELRAKLVNDEGYDELVDNIEELQMTAADGKERPTAAANTETIFRIMQSIPSKEARMFKKWLARVGYERILEFQNPEIAIKRAVLDYKMQGYDDEWIDARVRSILVRNELVSEWAKRGVREGGEYAKLTNVIQEATFGLGVRNHKDLKRLRKHHNLRDHMSDMELIFTMLGEKSTKDIAVATDANGFMPNREAATQGGKISGDARLALEKKTGKRVVSSNNFLLNRGARKELPKSDH